MDRDHIDPADSGNLSAKVDFVSSESRPYHTLLECIRISDEDYKKCSPELIGFVNSISISPKARKLLADIKDQYGFVELCLLPPTQIFSDASWSLDEKKILITHDYVNNFKNFSHCLLWELCNAANTRLNSASFLQLSPDEDAYAFLVEASEYLSTVRVDDIKIDYFMNAQQCIPLKNIIEQTLKEPIAHLIMSAIALRENFMEYWHGVNQEVVGSNYRGSYNSADLYRHADVYRSHYCYWKNTILQSVSASDDSYWKEILSQRISDHISDNEQDLVVYAFSQKSFDLAKKETKLLKSSDY